MAPGAAPVTLDTTSTPDTPGRQGVHMLDHALAEPYWLDDLDLARRHLAREYAGHGAALQTAVPRKEHGLVFGVAVFLAKTTQTANIMYVVDEIGATGAREAVVAELRMREAAGLDKAALDEAALDEFIWPPHPYDPELRGLLPFNPADDERWDEKFPWHPLTCVRAWLRDLDRIVTVDPAFAALPDFRGTTRRAQGR